MRCITVSSPSGTYLVGRSMIPTHNSPWAAGLAIYYTAADGVRGGSVEFAAKNGAQARKIVGRHAFEMISNSPELDEEIKKNNTEGSFTHLPTRSRCGPKMSGDKRSQDAEHGKNLNAALIDEMQVVDRATLDRLHRSYKSRVEPMELSVSTAGDDIDSAGKEEFDYAVKIINGEKKDTKTFAAVYAAPPDLSRSQLEKNPEKYIQMANPAMGHIVDMKETLEDYNQVKDSAYKLSVFMYEILNVWQSGSSKWLAPGVWVACGGHTEVSFKHFEKSQKFMALGLDLALMYDLCAAVFAGDNEYGSADIIPMFWTTRKLCEKRAERLPFLLDWLEAGFLIDATSFDGDGEPTTVIDFQKVRNDIMSQMRRLNMIGMIADNTFAGQMLDEISNGVIDEDGRQVISGTGIPYATISQSNAVQALPVTKFENDLIAKKIRHADNPVLTWQAGNAEVKEINGLMRIVKPSKHSPKTVDGMQAATWARFGLCDYDEFERKSFDFYEDHDLEFV